MDSPLEADTQLDPKIRDVEIRQSRRRRLRVPRSRATAETPKDRARYQPVGSRWVWG